MQTTLANVLRGLDQRRLEPEVMDDPDLGEGEHRAALVGLARLNAWSCNDRALFRPIRRLARELGRPVRLLDVACGGGDQVVRLAQRARRSGFQLRSTGCDRNAVALDVAADHARRAGVEARFLRHDVVEDGVPEGYDVVLCTLFLHHLDDDDALGLFESIAAAAPRLAVVQDLLRNRRGAWLAAAASRLLTRSPVVRTDALLSVGAAFDLAEVERLAQGAGMYASRLTRVWPLRWQLEWRARSRGAADTDELIAMLLPQRAPSEPARASRAASAAERDDPEESFEQVAGAADSRS